MIYSPEHNIAFAHYPKSGGTSVTEWFIHTFEDARFLETERLHEKVSHLNVKGAIDLIQSEQKNISSKHGSGGDPQIMLSDFRVMGVLRDPFDMLVSLYEFWKHVPFSSFGVTELPPLIRAARENTFFNFVEMAVVGKKIQNYHSFFNVDGPLWHQTYLMPFENMEQSLARICVKLELPTTKADLRRLNINPESDRKIHTYLCESSSLLSEVEYYFKWYYTEGIQNLV